MSPILFSDSESNKQNAIDHWILQKIDSRDFGISKHYFDKIIKQRRVKQLSTFSQMTSTIFKLVQQTSG